jgi:DNA/RNA-binding domain of Phe-tRNA-synthetase-like protein
MKITVDPKIFTKFPGLAVGIVVAEGLDNNGDHPKLKQLLSEVQDFIKQTIIPENISKHPMISNWRAAYQDFGAKPKKYNCSVESLLRRIFSGEKIPRISKLVDLYNYVSLKHLIPVGADDLDKVDGDVTLTFASGSERFLPMGAKEEKNPKEGEVIYKDSQDVLCRRWNWRECDKSKITHDTKRVVVYAEALPPFEASKLKDVLKDISELVSLFCSCESKTYTLTKEKPSVEI